MKTVAAMVLIGALSLPLHTEAKDSSGITESSPPKESQPNQKAERNHYPTDKSPLPVRVIETPSDSAHRKTRETEADKRDDEHLEAEIRTAVAAEKEVTATYWQTGLGFIGAILLLWTLVETRRTAKAATKQADTAHKEFIATHRPKIEIRRITLDRGENTTTWVSKSTKIQYVIANVGETEARIIEGCVCVQFTNKLPAIPDMTDAEVVSEVTLAGGAHAIRCYAPEHCNLLEYASIAILHANNPIVIEGKKIFFYGYFCYLDQKGDIRRMGFCRVFNPNTDRFDYSRDQNYEYDA